VIRRRHLAILLLALVAVMWPCPARASFRLTPEFGSASLSLAGKRAKSSAASSFHRAPLPRPRAGRRPSTDKGEAAGEARWVGAHPPQGFTESYTYEATGEVKTVKDRLDRTTTMAHDQLGRLLAMVDTLGRSHGRSYSVPTAGAWTGPTLTRASADATSATASLSTPLRDGDYQLGVNALQPDGMPARISLYRDATFALGFTHTFDEAQRLMSRTDRASLAIDSTATLGPAASYWHELRGYDTNTSAPVLTSFQSNNTTRTETTVLSRNAEFDVTSASGFAPSNAAATYAYTRDAGGRLLFESHKLTSSGLAGDPTAPQFNSSTFGLSYTYGSDGRVRHIGSADGGHAQVGSVAPNPPITTLTPGSHDFTYDARGLVATQTDFGGTYRYRYDAVGRNTRLEFPDGHVRVQVYDDLGRITSRCYEYPADPALTRCYGAAYDPVGNPLRLSDPEGADLYEYDALDRLKKVTRLDGAGLTVAVEDYAFNALGALKTHAGLAVDHRRPRLGGGGSADAAVPATQDAQPVTLDLGGRVTAMSGLDLTWSPTVFVEPTTFAYYELDLAGNVRRLRRSGGEDLGGYRYSAFGRSLEDTVQNYQPNLFVWNIDLRKQPLRWKGMWRFEVAGTELYDARARMRSPKLGKGRGQGKARPTKRAPDSGPGTPTNLARVGRKATKDKETKFSNLMCHLKLPLLEQAYQRLKKTAAGVDGVTWSEYGQNLEARLTDLQDRIHRGSYQPLPVRRAYIPKADGRERPVGDPGARSVRWSSPGHEPRAVGPNSGIATGSTRRGRCRPRLARSRPS